MISKIKILKVHLLRSQLPDLDEVGGSNPCGKKILALSKANM